MIAIMSRARSAPWEKVFAGAPRRFLAKGSVLFRRGDPVRSAFLLIEGSVVLQRDLPDGELLTLHIASAGEMVAQASIFSTAYHCDAVCMDVATVAVRHRRDVEEALATASVARDALGLAARDVQDLRTRVEVMRLRGLKRRLDAYLTLFGPPPPGGWVRVAEWIGVTPAALYRELARRRASQLPRSPDQRGSDRLAD